MDEFELLECEVVFDLCKVGKESGCGTYIDFFIIHFYFLLDRGAGVQTSEVREYRSCYICYCSLLLQLHRQFPFEYWLYGFLKICQTFQS